MVPNRPRVGYGENNVVVGGQSPSFQQPQTTGTRLAGVGHASNVTGCCKRRVQPKPNQCREPTLPWRCRVVAVVGGVNHALPGNHRVPGR